MKINVSTFIVFCLVLAFSACTNTGEKTKNQHEKTAFSYTVSIPEPASHQFHVELNCSGLAMDTINFKMPEWMPGYYQIMDYSDAVTDFEVFNSKGNEVATTKLNDHTWQAVISKEEPFKIYYKVDTDKKFVASSYVDSTHAYIVPPSMFMFVEGYLNSPVNVEVNLNGLWKDIATGLEDIAGENNKYSALNFDILYDCPLLIGNLESLSPFYIDSIKHEFIGYELGDFDKEMFMDDLEKIVKTATDLMGDIPYKNYKFIGVGPRLGGIEHLNNTTVSFNGNTLNNKGSYYRMMSFLAHEYFHHYNVKRIRPYELGPFNYDKENKTNLLWVSEGLTVYYENIIVKRSGVLDEKEFFFNLKRDISVYENDPGRFYQSLVESSYYTWEEGPFGNPNNGEDRSISYYIKGPVVGLILDFAIREATQNQKSLDDVMRFLYNKYYKELQRGFTDAEFQQVCENIAGTSLNPVFEYVYTTKEIDYNKYLAYAGLILKVDKNPSGFKIITLEKMQDITPEQLSILNSWMGEK